ncbi:unnamed protein product, partial [Candidula unifasciata]
PKMSMTGATLKVAAGVKAYMQCKATGDPAPTITWDKDGTPVHLLSSRYSVNKDNWALRVFTPQIDDVGNYTCTATNRLGVDKTTYTLLVMVQPESQIVSPSNLTVMELTNQQLVCRSRGVPRPFFEWLIKNNPPIRADTTTQGNVSLKRLYSIEREVDEHVYESVLYFQPVNYKDFGNFACVAYNDIGHSRVRASLDVLFSPKVLSDHSSLQPVVWWEGHPTNLSCVVAGNDVPEITWFRNRKRFTCNKLEEWEEASQITSSCIVSHPLILDGGPGVYSCRAKNRYGKTPVHEFHVRENFPPAAVEFSTVSVKPDEVVLAVKIPKKRDTPPATYVLASYKLAGDVGGVPNPEYERMGDVDKQGEGTVKLVGVRENSEYVVKVRARNSVGFGPETVSVINTALPPAATETTPWMSTISTVMPIYDNSYDEDVNQLTNRRDDVRQLEFEESPEALGVRSSAYCLRIYGGCWFCPTNFMFFISWILLVLRCHCVS